MVDGTDGSVTKAGVGGSGKAQEWFGLNIIAESSQSDSLEEI